MLRTLITTPSALVSLVAAGALLLSACGGATTDANTDATTGAGQAAFNQADVRFAQEMIPHHQQAVEMAELVQQRTPNPAVLDLAADIEAAQGPEIEQMTGWLESWGEEVPTGSMGHEGHGGSGGMVGMMTAEQLEQLGTAEGPAFDRMFLAMMIEHHEGAITMARTEQANGRFPEAVALAEKIERDQRAEIALMEKLLDS